MAILILGICLSLRKHIRLLTTSFVTNRAIVVNTTIFFENIVMDNLHTKPLNTVISMVDFKLIHKQILEV